MRNIEKYYDNTESEKPRNNVQYLIEEVKCNPGKAIELGCGAGNDTVYLIKNNWNVLAIYSLPFCNKDKFEELWNKIKRNILPNRIFCL